MRRRNSRSGSSLIEFTLLGIPVIFITISIISVSIDMWQFQTLAYTTELTARYISVHGATCAQNGNTCTIKVGDIATYFTKQGPPLDKMIAVLKLTDGSGTTTCNPVNSCLSNSTQFPNSSFNTVGHDVTVKATYALRNPIAMYWPPDVDNPADFTVAATSRQRILF